MRLSDATKLVTGIQLIVVPTIQFGGTFLLRIVSGGFAPGTFTEFQRAMFRAGHAHAGVLLILGIVAQILADSARLPAGMLRAVRAGFFAAPILISGGFFGAAAGGEQPGGLIALLWLGAALLAVSVVALGVGLIRARGAGAVAQSG